MITFSGFCSAHRIPSSDIARYRCDKTNPQLTKKTTGNRPPEIVSEWLKRDVYVAWYFPFGDIETVGSV